MKFQFLKPVVSTLCIAGFISVPAFASAATTNADNDRMQAISAELASLQNEVRTLKSELNTKRQTRVASNKKQPKNVAPRVAHRSNNNYTNTEIAGFANQERRTLPFDLDVPGQAFVSTGPYIGVPYQFAGSDLIINSPSVNLDVQLLNVRKTIQDQLKIMNGEITKEPYHSHLLFSGLIESQANYVDHSGVNNGGTPVTDINLTSVNLDAIIFGPTKWTLGFIEFSYDDSTPASSVFTSTSNYRVSNSRVYINKAFVTIGDFSTTPFYGTFGQFYVPFGRYSYVLVSDPLTRLLGRTKARSIELGYQEQTPNAFYASTYIFRGDSHAPANSRISNGGVNVGFKSKEFGFLKTDIGAGVIANLADSGGMQSGNSFNSYEQIVHRVPAYNLRAIFGLGDHLDFIGEFIGASTRFNPFDMAYQGHGAKPWALDAEGVYSFMIFDNKPSSVGLAYGASRQALALGIPANRYSMVFNTSLLRNTLESLELRRDYEYAASSTAGNAGGVTATPETGGIDNVVTAQFDYYF